MQTAEHHREQFELAYATAWAKDRNGDETPEQLAAEIKSWRIGDTYGEDLPSLRFGWEGYQWARNSKCLAQIEEPSQPVAEICSASHDDAQFGERAIKPLRDISGFEYGTPLYAGAAPAAVAGPGWQAAADWLRNNYQDHPNIASLCDALVAAAPALEAPAAPAGEDSLPSGFDVRRTLQFIHDTFKKDLDAGYRTKDKEFAVSMAAPALAAAPQAPAAPVAVPWDNFPAYLIDHCEGQTITEEGLQRALAAMLANPQYAPAAPAAPAVDADPLGLRDVGEAFMQAIERNSDALKAVGCLGPMDCPSEIVVDLLNMLEEANTTSALGEWVATLEVDSGGGLDYETVPPCTLPPGCYPLYRAAQAAAKGEQP